MAFLILDGTTIRCRRDQTQQKDNEHRIDRMRMFDGAARMTRGAIYREWDVVTALLTDAEVTAAREKVNTNNPPLDLTGDITRGTDCSVMPVPGTWTPITTGNGLRWQGRFQLLETFSALADDIPVLAEDVAWDFDADDAVIESCMDPVALDDAFTYNGVNSVPNGAALGGPLEAGARRQGKYQTDLELNGHAFVRRFWWNEAYSATVAGTALTGLTIIMVGRPGTGVLAYPFGARDELGHPILYLGVESGLLTGLRRGPSASETGEISEFITGGVPQGTFVEADAAYSGMSPSDSVSDPSSTNGEGTPPGGAFDIMAAMYDSTDGLTRFFKNGFLCPNEFHGATGTFDLASVDVGSENLRAEAGQVFDWARLIGYGRVLTSDELLSSIRALGIRYGITTA